MINVVKLILFFMISSNGIDLTYAVDSTGGSYPYTQPSNDRTNSEWVQYPSSNGGAVIKSGSPDLIKIYSPIGDCIQVKHNCGMDLFYPFGTPEEVSHNKTHHPVCNGGTIVVNTTCSLCGSTQNTCNSGATAADVADSATHYLWTCSDGVNPPEDCALAFSPVNGACDLTSINGCSDGDLNDLADSVTNYRWQCDGKNGGSDSATCSIAIPTCGSSNGDPATVKPTTNLCSSGNASVVAGTGPWTWSCSSTVTGTTSADCSTTNALSWEKKSPSCEADPGNTVEKFADGFPDPQGTACTLAGNIGWWETLPTGSGCWIQYECGGLTPVNGVCGPANNASKPSAPADRCARGTESNWADGVEETWDCLGIAGGSKASCSTSSANSTWTCNTTNAAQTSFQWQQLRPAWPVLNINGNNYQQGNHASCRQACFEETKKRFPGSITTVNGEDVIADNTKSITVTVVDVFFQAYSNYNIGPPDSHAAYRVSADNSGFWCGCYMTLHDKDTALTFGSGHALNSYDGATEQLERCTLNVGAGVPLASNSQVGSCGTANRAHIGKVVDGVMKTPLVNKCSSGIPTMTTGSGPWSWSCLGTGSMAGNDATCRTSAGACGSDHGNSSCSSPPNGSAACAVGAKYNTAGTALYNWRCGTATEYESCSCGTPPPSGLTDGTICVMETYAPDTAHGRPSCADCINFTYPNGIFVCDGEDYTKCGTVPAYCSQDGSMCSGNCVDR